jgi:phosphoglycerate dehydrogenase-like enzyme
MIFNKRIAVTVNTFSKNKVLLNELKEYFPDFSKTEKRYPKKELISALEFSDGAIIGMDEINENVLKYCKNLKVISKFGVGLDNINFEDCKKYGVEVKYFPGVNKRSVSELTLGFMLNLIKNSYQTSLQLKNGLWNKKGGRTLSEKTIGIIGIGNVGKDLIKLLKPFNPKILVNDIRKDKEQRDFYKENNLIETSKQEIYKNSDVITLHTPLTKDTENLINKNSLSFMKPSSYLINTARGRIVNEEDLYNALKNKKISGAALDVYYEEPPKNKKLLVLENLICTPHIGGNSKEAVLAMGRASIKGLEEYFKNES